ncbi:MAG: protein kinase domain-containing protein, partial [Prochlorococcaceae cyanobacterium]
MPTPAEAASGALLERRYRLDEVLSEAERTRLWRGADTLVGELPVAIRAWWGLSADQFTALQERLERLKALLHPQIPRLGEQLPAEGGCWQVREWINGRTYQDLLQARQERQLVFGSGEVLLLLRQLLPALAALHGQNLVHGDLTPANLVRRDSDGLPVLIDFGLQDAVAGQPLTAATAGYAPPQARHEPYEAWMDLYSLGVVALVLLSGEEPAALMDPVSLAWRWPEGIALDVAFRQVLKRLLSTSPEQRFHSAAEVAEALAALTVPESTGPVSRSDR